LGCFGSGLYHGCLNAPKKKLHPRKRSGLPGSWKYTLPPKHGSRPDIAEVELSALAAQCLGSQRISDMKTLNAELSAWHTQRNRKQKGVDWQFTTTDARTKLKRLYPVIIE
jgi:hypothetical protein